VEALCLAVNRIGTLQELVVFCHGSKVYQKSVAAQFDGRLKFIQLESRIALSKAKQLGTGTQLELLSWEIPKATFTPYNDLTDACNSLKWYLEIVVCNRESI